MEVHPYLPMMIGLLLFAAALVMSAGVRAQLCSWGITSRLIWAAGAFALALIVAVAALGAWG